MAPDTAGGLYYQLIANKEDLTDKVRKRLFSLQYTDGAGVESDVMEMVLVDDDPNQPIEVPATGAEIQLALGYQLNHRDMGLFIVDEIEVAGYPCAMVIRGRAAPFTESKMGKNAMQTQKNRSWEKGYSLQKMLETIAGEHGLEPKISPSMAGIQLPHMDQKEESDLNFLLRICRKYDAVLKPGGGKLIITKRGEGVSASGEQLPTITIRRQDVVSFRVSQKKRDSAGTVISYYKPSKKAARYEVKVGNGEPVKRIGTLYPSKDMAVEAAKAEWNSRQRDETELNITVMGWPELMAEMIAEVTEVHAAADGKWLIKTCVHRVNDGGYTCDLTMELPNKDKPPEVTERELKSPKVGKKDDGGLDDDGPAGVITLPPA